MLRLVWNADPHNPIGNWLVNFFIYGSGGGQTSYIFGARKVLNYRLSHNFTVDRYHRTAGLLGKSKTLAANMEDAHSHIHDVTWTPIGESDKFVKMILPIMFSLGLLAWDLVIVYKFKIKSTALIALKDYAGKLAGIASEPPSHVGMLMITLLEVFEEGMIQLMEIIERCLCTANGAVNFARTIEESIKASEKRVLDAANALVQAQAIAPSNAVIAAPALAASQQQIQTTTQVVNAGQQNAIPNAVNNVVAPVAGVNANPQNIP